MIMHHFFGKECFVDRALNDYSDLAKHLRIQNFSLEFEPVFVNQIHSNDVIVIDEISKIPPKNNRPKADAIVTNLKNIVIGVITADCTPIILFDEKNSVIAVVHAGWKGARKNITSNVINKMLKLGATKESISAVIGPTIRQKSYEISEEFYDDFLSENVGNKIFFIPSNKENHWLFDLPSYVKEKLKNDGIKNISDKEIDTYSNPEKLFSYRRSTHLGEAYCGRNISIAMIK